MAYDQQLKADIQRDCALYVGKRIKMRRTELDITIAKLSEQTGVTQAQLSLIERGGTDVKLSTLSLICHALLLDIDIDAFERRPMRDQYADKSKLQG